MSWCQGHWHGPHTGQIVEKPGTGKKPFILHQMKVLCDTCQKNIWGLEFFQAPKFNPQEFFPEYHTAHGPHQRENLHLKCMGPTP